MLFAYLTASDMHSIERVSKAGNKGECMCGRFSLAYSWEEMFNMLGLLSGEDVRTAMPARYNIAPTQPIATIFDGQPGQRLGKLARWGFVPSWVKDPKSFTLLTNARSETASEKPSFKNAMRHRRVLIPASGFYEWKRFGKGKGSQAYWVTPRNGEPVMFGGLMETWAGADGSEIDTACILTTAANDTFAEVHHRLPLVINPDDVSQWLDCKSHEPRDVDHLLHPATDDFFEAIPVSDAVNKVANTDPSIQDRTEPKDIEAERPDDDEQMSLFK